MGIRDRIAKANEAARDVHERGAPERAASRQAHQERVDQLQRPSARQKLSDVSADGRCPDCGGSQFTAKRSKKGKVLAAFAAPKSQVKCVTCGAMFKRG